MKTDLHVLEIEETEYWKEEFLKKYNIKNIYTVYLVDKSQITNCCEITPSYWLEALYPTIELENDNEEAWEEVYRSFFQDDGNGYYHCSYVDKISSTELELNFEYESEEEYSEKMEEVSEYCRCNHII